MQYENELQGLLLPTLELREQRGKVARHASSLSGRRDGELRYDEDFREEVPLEQCHKSAQRENSRSLVGERSAGCHLHDTPRDLSQVRERRVTVIGFNPDCLFR